jgi:voltage-gated sodium channel
VGPLFSQTQLAQLREVVKNTIREEIQAAIQSSQVAFSPSSLTRECSPGAQETIQLKAEPPPQDDENEVDAVRASSAMSRSSTLARLHEEHRSMMDLSADKQPATLKSVVNSTSFDAVIGFVIVVNACSIGVETQLRLDGEVPDAFFWIESFCLSCFLLELFLRLMANGMQAVYSTWFIFDAILVFTGVLALWILEPISRSGVVSKDQMSIVDQLLALRLLRLMRLARALRLLVLFRELWKMCRGLMKAASTMFSVSVLVMLSIYVFSCLGVDVITKSETLAAKEHTRGVVEQYFSSLPKIMLTLMQFSNADSIAKIYTPLVVEHPILAVYFLVLWLVVTVALMNLVTAIIVETAMAKGREDNEEELVRKRSTFKRLRPRLMNIFSELDRDDSGKVSLDEVKSAVMSGRLKFPDEIRDCVAPEQLMDIFEVFDADMSGEIDQSEFLEGMLVLAISSVPMELHLVRLCFTMLMQTSENVKKLVQSGSLRSGKHRSR